MGQTERGDKATVSALTDDVTKTPETSPITTLVAADSNVEPVTATAITHDDVVTASWKLPTNEDKQAAVSPSVITTPTVTSSTSTCPVSVEPVRRTELPTSNGGIRSLYVHVPNALYDPVTQRRMVNPVVNAAGDSYDRSTVQFESDDSAANATAAFTRLYYPNRALESILKLQYEYEQKLLHQQQQQGLDEQEVQGAVEMINAGTPASTEERKESTLHNVDLEIGTDSSKSFDAARKGEKAWYYATTSGQDVNDNAGQEPSRPTLPLRQLPEAFYCPITCDIMVDPWIGPDGNTYDYDAIQEWLEQNDHPNCSPVTREPLTLNQLRPNHALYELIQYEVVHKQPHNRHVSIQKWMNATPCTTRSARPHHPTVPPPPRLAPQVSSSERPGQTDVEEGGHDTTAVATTAARQGSSADAERDDDCCCCCCCSCSSGCSCCHACAGLVMLGLVLLIVGAASWQFFIFLFVVFLVAGMVQGVCN